MIEPYDWCRQTGVGRLVTPAKMTASNPAFSALCLCCRPSGNCEIAVRLLFSDELPCGRRAEQVALAAAQSNLYKTAVSPPRNFVLHVTGVINENEAVTTVYSAPTTALQPSLLAPDS